MIQGVKIINLKKYTDDRGWVTELYRDDETSFKPKMAYASFSAFDVIRGPHEHVDQSDFFCFTGPGDFEMHLWDNRQDSETFGKYTKLKVGESNPVTVLVPPGVIHGYKCISEQGAYYVNLPNQLYAGKNKQEEVDEIRHENDLNSKFRID
jgi:dTDP-4-dehydrorhamnose 3,5-epimerase